MLPRLPSVPRPRHLAAGLLAVLAASCATPAPPVEKVHPLGVVRAEDAAAAERFGAMVTDLQPRVAEILPDTPERQTEVWVQHKLQHRFGKVAPHNVKGFTLISGDDRRGRIHMRANTDHPEWFLAHELVHSMLGPTWRTLPGVLEEGLCDVVAAQLNPDVGPRIRALRAIEASMWFGRMRLRLEHEAELETDGNDTLEVWFHYENGPANQDLLAVLEPSTLEFKRRFEEMSDSLYGLGFVVVERIVERHGLEGLHAMCIEASEAGFDTIPTERLLEAAELETPTQRLLAPWELLGAEEFPVWVDLLPTFHADLLVQLFGDRFRDVELERFLELVDPKLEVSGGQHIRVADHPRVRSELARMWPGGVR